MTSLGLPVGRPPYSEAAYVHNVYTRDQLLPLYTSTPPPADVVVRLRTLNLYTVCRLQCRRRGRHRRACRHEDCASVVCCYRGCRAGRLRRRPVTTRPTICGAFILDASSGPSQRVTRPSSPRPCLLVPVHIDRHSTPPQIQMTFGCLNIRSLASKLDDLLEVRRDHLVDVLFLVETWHDSDSVCINRLRTDGFQVVERARPRISSDVLSTNHGGVAAVAVKGVRLTRINLGIMPGTFELLVVRVTSSQTSCIVATVYRPGSVTVTPVFYRVF